MQGYEIAGITSILIIAGVFTMLFNWLRRIKKKDDGIFNFERDHEVALQRNVFKSMGKGEAVFIGAAGNRKAYIESDAKHVFICGTTGSGKTIALSNFIKAGCQYDYPMLIIDGKGDTDAGSILEITKTICPSRKLYVINLNEPNKSDKYNPFINTNIDVIKDMLINMTTWSEEHYKYNTERYILRLLKLMMLSDIKVSLGSLTKYLPTSSFSLLSRNLSAKGIISKEEHIEDIELAKISGKIAEGAAARFATINDSELGQIFHEDGIDIYTALEGNAIILFILNPLLYPETSPLIGNLIVIDSKKAVSNFYKNKKKRIFYIMDEINVYASSSLLDLVNKSRTANITCILATQSLSDLDVVSSEFKEQIIENCNNYLILRQNSSVNAEHWSNIIGTRMSMQATYQVTGSGGDAKSTELGSVRRTREYIYHPDDIKLLKAGTAIFLSRDNMIHSKIKVNKPF